MQILNPRGLTYLMKEGVLILFEKFSLLAL